MDINIAVVLNSIYILIFVWLSIHFLKWLHVYVAKLKKYSCVPHPPMLPFIGNLYMVNNNGVDFLKQTKEIALSFKNESFILFWRGIFYNRF
jgi:hypothetical protein